MISEFDGNDNLYQAWLAAHPRGFVINTTRRPARRAAYMVLHRARCARISRYTQIARPPGAFTERDYVKVCAPTVEELRAWAKTHGRPDGSFSNECGFCNPVSATAGTRKN